MSSPLPDAAMWGERPWDRRRVAFTEPPTLTCTCRCWAMAIHPRPCLAWPHPPARAPGLLDAWKQRSSFVCSSTTVLTMVAAALTAMVIMQVDGAGGLRGAHGAAADERDAALGRSTQVRPGLARAAAQARATDSLALCGTAGERWGRGWRAAGCMTGSQRHHELDSGRPLREGPQLQSVCEETPRRAAW